MKLIANLQEQVVVHLRQRIISGRLQPGTRLREELLAKEFGISRGPIRDALLTLTKEGLLTARPNAGVKVAVAPTGFKREVIVRLRRELEASALAAWFDAGDGVLLDALDANLTRYKAACRAGELDAVVELDMAFHRLLVESADDGSLVDVWLPIILRMYLRYSRHRSLLESHREHAGIVEAMHSGRKADAVARLRAHIV
jgi:DNA-binding GntR family transcriptional regulator